MIKPPKWWPADAYERNVFLSEAFEITCILGLSIELLFVLIFDKPLIEKIETAVSDAMIFLGVAGAFHFGRIARVIGETAQAEANARTKEAELRLEQLRHRAGQRRAEEDVFMASLQGKPSLPRVVIKWCTTGGDCWQLAMQLERLLRRAGWTVDSGTSTNGLDLRDPLFDFTQVGAPDGGAAGLVLWRGAGRANPAHEEAFDALYMALLKSLGGLSGKTDHLQRVPDGEFWIVVCQKP